MRPSDLTGNPADDEKAADLHHELIVDRKHGRMRQAGAASAEGAFIKQFKDTAERDLYVFLVGVLNYHFLDAPMHREVCQWLTSFPAYRKMLLMPRGHGKTTIVGRGIPLHAMVQPVEANIYFPGDPGNNLLCVMAGETEQRSIENLRVIVDALENNPKLRALWPHICWDNPRRQAKAWSATEIIIPREQAFSEPTVKAIGVGGAITGMHPRMLIKDDLTTITAANEPSTMQKAIEWHQASRALFSRPDTDIEYLTATYWAAYDLPNFIEANDHTVAVNTRWRAMIEDEEVIYPSHFGHEGAVEQIKREHPVLWPFLYFNTVQGSNLTDFDLAMMRRYTLTDGAIVFDENEQDVELHELTQKPAAPTPVETRGMPLHVAIDLGLMQSLRNIRGH